jgi:arylsulfatase A-like enzyme
VRRARWLAALAVLLVPLLGQHGCGRGDEPPSRAKRRSLVLIVVDTLRSDMLSGRKGEPAHMPFCHALARRGVLFPNAVAPAPWTLPSMTSLLSGLTPREHRIDRMLGGVTLARTAKTYAEALAAEGWQTAVYSGAPKAWGVPDAMFRGFQTGKVAFVHHGGLPQLETWRRSLDASRPFFLLLHLFEAHDPYGEANHPPGGSLPEPPEDFDPFVPREPWDWARRFMLDNGERVALTRTLGMRYTEAVVRYLWSGFRAEPRPELALELHRAYTEGVTWTDGIVKEQVEWLERHGLLDDALLVVTSDHGEAFGEHGTLEHGRVMYDEVLRVPLVLAGPAPYTGGRVVEGNVSLMDLMPTLMEALGVAPPSGSQGTSLAPLVEGREGGRIAASYERIDYDVTREDLERTLRSARSDRMKVILTWDVRRATLTAEAYDLAADPAERDDLARGTGSLAGVTLEPRLAAEVDRLVGELVEEGAPEPSWRRR